VPYLQAQLLLFYFNFTLHFYRTAIYRFRDVFISKYCITRILTGCSARIFRRLLFMFGLFLFLFYFGSQCFYNTLRLLFFFYFCLLYLLHHFWFLFHHFIFPKNNIPIISS